MNILLEVLCPVRGNRNRVFHAWLSWIVDNTWIYNITHSPGDYFLFILITVIMWACLIPGKKSISSLWVQKMESICSPWWVFSACGAGGAMAGANWGERLGHKVENYKGKYLFMSIWGVPGKLWHQKCSFTRSNVQVRHYLTHR